MIEAVEGNASGFVSERFTGHEAMNFMPGYYIRAKTSHIGNGARPSRSDQLMKRGVKMISLFLMILFVILCFKITGVIFKVIGALFGWIFGIIGWLVLAGLAVTVFSLAVIAVPIILIVGIAALIVAAAS